MVQVARALFNADKQGPRCEEQRKLLKRRDTVYDAEDSSLSFFRRARGAEAEQIEPVIDRRIPEFREGAPELRKGELVEVDPELHDIFALPRHPQAVPPGVGQTPVERKIELGQAERKLVCRIEVKEAARPERAVDLLKPLPPVLDMLERARRNDHIVPGFADVGILDVTELDIRLDPVPPAVFMRIRDELQADLDPLAAEPLLLAEDGKPSRADAHLEDVRMLVNRLERRYPAHDELEIHFHILERYLIVAFEIPGYIGQFTLENLHHASFLRVCPRCCISEYHSIMEAVPR